MLASPLYPTSISTQHHSDETTQYRPTKDIESFNKLLPAPVEFVEGSSSGTLAIAEGKYEPINGSPKFQGHESHELANSTQLNSVKTSRPSSSSSPVNGKISPLFTGALDTTWPKNVTVGSGFTNVGNTCFLNSALQCLLHTPPLLRVLLGHNQSPDPCRVKSGFCMPCALRAVMLEAHNRNGRPFVPNQVTTKLQTIAKHMRQGRQEDSHEFLRYAIDALQKSCLAGYPQKLDPKLAETTWVHKLFGGKLRSRVTCRDCGYNSDTFDNILDLSVDIHGVTSLKDALRKFVAVDYLKGSDKYKCEKCKRRVIAEKQFTVHDAPLALTVHLKRFSPLGRKMGHLIRYDERLSVAPFMSEDQFGPRYSLYGVISHAGGGPNSGHYFAHVKAANGSWFEMNDDFVTKSSGAPTNMKNAYILFYLQEKGQALEAAVSVKPIQTSPVTPRNGIIANMRKRKVVESEDEDEMETQERRLFIGPLLPTPTASPRDPQAETLKRKIEATTKTSLTATKNSSVLQNLTQYEDDDDVGEKVTDETGGDEEDPSGSSTQSAIRSSPPVPPMSSPVASSPSVSASTPVPPNSFYGTASSNGKKRKLPDLQDEDYRTPRSFGSNRKRYSYGGGSPYDRTSSGGYNTFSKRDKFSVNRYGRRKKKMIM
ncbi:hypothetical protein EW146_g6609 [Bondarzewia mesenterica]|uniref:Ubiquitin carboxyl-terminal hydrolase n=1 Tax=Bondarzewia mesenterica TaxID=1095465 RepID=A0A4S4LN37_9AGAM|nr:hypothetical protein EW146_g6609 [Bondarzewia mesenterica]